MNHDNILQTLHSLSSKLGMELLSIKLHELDLLYCEKDVQVIRDSVIDEVCAVMCITRAYLLDPISHREEKKQWSICFVCAILKNQFNFTLAMIKVIFDIDSANVSRRVIKINTLNLKSKYDVPTIQLYNKVIENLIEKKVILK